MKFAKMHGLGNDFIVFENFNDNKMDFKDLAKKVCDRHFGVGADGILLVEESDKADIRMEIINSDGSIAEMCGNGIRCFCKYVYDRGIVKKEVMEVETLAGVLRAYLRIEGSEVKEIKINMGRPIFEKSMIPFTGEMDNIYYTIEIDGKEYRASTILMGVPHTVIYVNTIDLDEVVRVGRKIEKLNIYPLKTNVNFVEVVNKDKIRIRTWERGAGLTLACGTGTCASVVTSSINNMTGRIVTAELTGGNMFIEYDGENVYMEGPAKFICEGELYL